MSENDHPPIDGFLGDLRMPGLVGVEPTESDRVQTFWALYEEQRAGRMFLIGLAMAFLSLADQVRDLTGDTEIEDALNRFEHETTSASGRPVNTLNLKVDDSPVRLRPTYNAVEKVYHYALSRYDFPHSPGHATQAWPQHRDLLEIAFAMSLGERRAAAERIWNEVLELPVHGRRKVGEATPRAFEVVLERFPTSCSGEPPGAVLQAFAFAYYRVDAPNVTLETGKVGSGSRRQGRVGDVDGWSGPELVLSIEVKDQDIADVSELEGFLRNLAPWPDATAIVVARNAPESVIAELRQSDINVITRASLLDSVRLWDRKKQSLAAREVYYFFARQQRHGRLIERFGQFLESEGITL